MTIIYEEFDTTAANLVADLKTRILSHPAWSAPAVTQSSTALTATIATSGKVATVSSTAGFHAGQIIKITHGANIYIRLIQSIDSTTTFTITADGGSFLAIVASGSTVVGVADVVRATTTRGASIIIDLNGGPESFALTRLSMRVWRTLVGGNIKDTEVTESTDRYVWWRPSGGTTTQSLHVVISISKEHLFIGIEGPRSHEAGAFSTTYGYQRQYFFVSDLVPYHSSDAVPAVVLGGCSTTVSSYAMVNYNSHSASVSRTADNESSWTECRLGSVVFPTAQGLETVNLERDCTLDGNKYLFPYVSFGVIEGLRGRLARFFYAGTTAPSPQTDYAAPVGERVTYDGIVYKLVAVNKGDGTSTSVWGPFGAAGNNNTTSIGRTVVVAVPYAVEVV